MAASTASEKCPACGASVSDAAQGLCTRCLLELGVALNVPTPPTLASDRSEANSCPSLPNGSKMTSPSGRVFGNYELLELIACGGMGVVYKARQRSLNRVVALKMILGGALANPSAVPRFRAEAEAAANLHHPNIVAIYETGEVEGQHFYSMEYIPGRNLADLGRGGPLPAKLAARYTKTIAEAVHYAHQHGILHRDLKPSNVIIDAADQPHVADFGLAKRLLPGSNLDVGAEFTLTGQLLGSPNFMPPEQARPRHRKFGPESDVYSIGAILYFLSTGRPPFQAQTIAETLVDLAIKEPIGLRELNPSAPRDLEIICLKCLEKEPHRRYRSAHALAEELGRFLEGRPIWAQPAGALQRTWRWCRRKPAAAGLAAGLAFAIVVGISGITWEWRRAEAATRQAETAYEQAKDTAGILALALADAETESTKGPLIRSPDGQWALHLSNNIASLYSVQTRRFQVVPLAEGASIRFAGFSGDSRRFVLGLRDGTVLLRQVQTLEAVCPPLRHEKPITCAQFSPDARRLATGSEDGRVRFWAAEDGKLLTPDGPQVDQPIVSLRFSPDGRRVISVTGKGHIIWWDTNTNRIHVPAQPQYPGTILPGQIRVQIKG